MIDLNGTLARLGNDRELLRETAQFLVEDVPRLLEAVEQNLRDGDVESMARGVHNLKGLALNFGDDAAVEAAELVESAVSDSDMSTARAQLDQLRVVFQQLAFDVRRNVLDQCQRVPG